MLREGAAQAGVGEGSLSRKGWRGRAVQAALGARPTFGGAQDWSLDWRARYPLKAFRGLVPISGTHSLLFKRRAGISPGKKRAHKLKKNARDTGRVSLGHPAGQTGVYRPVSQGFPVNCYRKTDRKGHFLPGHRPGCPRDTRPSRGFSEILCDFFLCAFSAPYFTA